MRTLLFILLILSCGVRGQNFPKYSNEYMMLGVGSRALSMGKVQTAVATGAAAGYWNPALLSRSTHKYQVGLMHAEYFAGIASYDYLSGMISPDSVSGLSLNIIRFGVDDIPDTRYLYTANGTINYDAIRLFNSADWGILLSYGRKVLPGLALGGSLKILRRTVGSFSSSWGYGIDLSAQYQLEKLEIGIMARDLTTTYNIWDHNVGELKEVFAITGNELNERSVEITLPRMVLGLAYPFTILEDYKILAATDLEITTDGRRNVLLGGDPFSINPRAGVELSYKDLFFLRAGLHNWQTIDFAANRVTGDFTTGAGVQLDWLTIDYALTDFSDISSGLYSHVFTLIFNIDPE